MKTILYFILVWATCSPCLSKEPPSVQEALTAIGQKNYVRALEILNGDLKSLAESDPAVTEDELVLHRARAHFLAGDFTKAVEVCDDLRARFPESVWRSKGDFLKAQSLAGSRKFEEALGIYQAAAARLFAEGRKDAIAGELIAFAEMFAKSPDPGKLDEPAADYGKALALYQQVLQVESSDAIREQAQFRIIQLFGRLNQWPEVSNSALAYLADFDPEWRGAFGSLERMTQEKNLQAKLAGSHRFHVRYLLGEGLYRQNQRDLAIKYLRELDGLVVVDGGDHRALRADAHWLKLMAMSSKGAPSDVDSWVKEARDYLAKHADHIWAANTVFRIAEVFQTANRYEEARQAFSDYREVRGYSPPLEKPLTLDEASAADFEKRMRNHQEFLEEASYRIGVMFWSERKFEEAAVQWTQTAQDFPNGARWGDCQRGLVTMKFERVLEVARAIQESPEEGKTAARILAKQKIEEYLVSYPLDGRLPQLLFILGEISYQEGMSLVGDEKGKPAEETRRVFEQAINEWRRLLSKYQGTNQAQVAEMKIAEVYEEQLGDYVKAVEIYAKMKGDAAAQRLSRLKAKSLNASSPKVFGTSENPTVTLTVRNVEKVTVRQYWIDFESFFSKDQNLANIEALDVDLVEPDKTWEITVPDFQAYQELRHEVPLPFEDGKARVCVIKVEGEKLESTTVIVRSDLDIALRSSRKEALVFARDWKSGAVAEGVKVVLASGAKVVATGMTNQEGVWHYQGDDLTDVDQLRVLAVGDRGIATHQLQIGALSTAGEEGLKVLFHTAREAYRPGEEVKLKLVAREPGEKGYRAPEDRKFALTVSSENGRVLFDRQIELNDFGTAEIAMTVPEQLSGNLVLLNLSSAGDATFQKSLPIEHGQVRRVQLFFDLERRHIFPGGIIKGVVKAQYRWGAPLADRVIVVKLPGGLSQELRTNELGEAVFSYPTEDVVDRELDFQAMIPGEDADPAQEFVSLVQRDYRVEVTMDKSLALAGRDFKVNVLTKSLDDKAVSRELSMKVIRTEMVIPNSIINATPGLEAGQSTSIIERILAEKELVTDATTGEAVVSFNLPEGENYRLEVVETGEGGALLQQPFRVSGDSDPAKLVMLKETGLQFEKTQARVELFCRLKDETPALLCLESNGILDHRVIVIKPGSNIIDLPLEVRHAPGFQLSVMALADRKLFEVAELIEVRRKLEVVMTVKDDQKLEPGKKVQVRLMVRDASGRPMRAETALSIIRPGDSPVSLAESESYFQHVCDGELFTSGSSTGFQHQGRQIEANQEVAVELQRQEAQVMVARQFRDASALADAEPQRQMALPQSVLFGNQQAGIQQYGIPSDGLTSFLTPGTGRTSLDYRSETVMTNDQGEALIEMLLPAEAGDWKVLAEAISEDGGLGGSTQDLRLREELSIRLEVPDSLVEGDVFQPGVIISRLGDEAAKGDLKLMIQQDGGVAVVQSIPVELLESQKSIQLLGEPVTVGKQGLLGLEVELSFAGETSKDSRSLAIRPWGALVSDQGGAMAGVGKSSFTLSLPEKVKAGRILLNLTPRLSDSLLALMESSSPRLMRSPRSHPADVLLGRAALYQYFKGRKGDTGSLAREIENGVAGLTVLQQEQGGWSAVLGRTSADVGLSALAYEGLLLAQSLGFKVDEKTLNQGNSYLQSQLGNAGNNERALIQYVLSCGGKADFSMCNRLFRERADLSPFGRAHLAAAFLNLQRSEFSKQLLEALGEVTSQESVTLARALQAWSGVEANQQVADELEKRLWSGCGVAGFSADGARGVAVLGLVRYHQVRENVAEDYRAVVSVNGTEIAKVHSAELAGFGVLEVPAEVVKGGKNELVVTVEGRGILRVGATAYGFSEEFSKEDWGGHLKVAGRQFYHPGLTYRGLNLRSTGNSLRTLMTQGEQVRVLVDVRNSRPSAGEVEVWEKIPAGFEYVRGSLDGDHSGARIAGGYLVVTYVGSFADRRFSYEMVAQYPGTWRVLPSMILPGDDPDRLVSGEPGQLIIRPRGVEANEPYRINSPERYELATLYFRDQEFDAAMKELVILRKEAPQFYEAEVARMILWIETSRGNPDARNVADSFEVLNERSPELEIPFEKILKVGEAYRSLGEFERGMDVFLATLEAGFATDAFVGVALEDQGRLLDAVDYQKELWKAYPDQGEIVNSWFALTQQMFNSASSPEGLMPRKGQQKAPESELLFGETVSMLDRFLVTSADHPLADDAAFTLANAYFSLKNFEAMVRHSQACQTTFPDSEFADNFKYLEALGNFWLRNYDVAFAKARVVAEGSGKDKNLAAYICAQILHAQGKPAEAMSWYERVKGNYPDAADSIAWFERKEIALSEVEMITSGDPVEVILKHRNIAKADIQVYRVDLMKLYLREKNLSNISQVNLAGISPKHVLSLDLGGKEASDHETTVSLPIQDDGAYLIICRGDYLYASGLVLVTPLKLEIQEDVGGSSVRATLTDRASGDYLDGVHVKAVGSNSSEFVSGETDLRGVWKAEGIAGLATVIARDDDGRYAFYRGSKILGGSQPQLQQVDEAPKEKSVDWGANNYMEQKTLIEGNGKWFDENRRGNKGGVKVNRALKK